MEILPLIMLLSGIIVISLSVLAFKALESIYKGKYAVLQLQEQSRYREAVNETLKAIAQIAESDKELAERLSQELLSKETIRPLIAEEKSRFLRPIPTKL